LGVEHPGKECSGLEPKPKCGREENGAEEFYLKIKMPRDSDRPGITKLVQMAI
jgi:hypothetical protein